MNFIKKIGLAVAAVFLVSGIFVTASSAQPGNASWYGNNGRHLGWYKGRHRGWDRDRGWRERRARYYYGPTRYRNYGYQNYYPGYGYGSGIGSAILNSLGLPGYYNSGYRGYPGGYYYRHRGDRERREWRKRHWKHRHHWGDDDDDDD